MIAFFARLTLTLFSLCALSLPAIAGRLDDYYLQQFGEAKNILLQKAVLLTTDIREVNRCGMPLKRGLRRDWPRLEPTTQKILAKQLALSAITNEEIPIISSKGHFRVHYASTGTDAPQINDYTDGNGALIRGIGFYTGLTSAKEWANVVAETFEDVYSKYTSDAITLDGIYIPKYNPAPLLANNSGVYEIYLKQLSTQGYYGYTDQDTLSDGITVDPRYYIGSPFTYSYASYIAIDNDFTENIYTTYHGGSYSPLQSLQITAAHEYHHAIQYGYNFYFDFWYAEATSTWMEDELYPDINQNYDYILGWFSENNSIHRMDPPRTDPGFNSQAYGRWIFNRYLSEKHSSSAIRDLWAYLGTRLKPDSGDISMIPVIEEVLHANYNTTLGDEFFGFVKRVYSRDWTSQPSDTSKIPTYSPIASYSIYPVNNTVSKPMAPMIALPDYSFAYFKFFPADSPLTITIAKSPGIRTAVFTANFGEIPISSDGTSYFISDFANSGEVVLLIANITNTNGQNANFSTDGTTVPPTEPSSTPVSVITPVATKSSSGGSGSGCFIATAAYGSYLHPRVQLLRDFRDEYLLTNVPGRAFVAFYYRCSPPLADFIARHQMLRGVTRLALTPLVAAVAHPLISAASLLLLFGALLTSLLRRIKAARLNAHTYVIRTT